MVREPFYPEDRSRETSEGPVISACVHEGTYASILGHGICGPAKM